MIKNEFVPNIDLFSRISTTRLNTDTGVAPMRLTRIEKPETGDFKSVFSGLIENLKQEAAAPDQLMQDLMMGNPNVDIHDVTTAMAKSEIGITLASNIATKVIQAYEKITQIQI